MNNILIGTASIIFGGVVSVFSLPVAIIGAPALAAMLKYISAD